MNWKDIFSKAKVYIHGAVVAAGTAVTASITQAISSGTMPTSAQLQSAGVAGLLAGGVYLLKTLFMGSASDQPKQ
jgi:hypothetical protein